VTYNNEVLNIYLALSSWPKTFAHIISQCISVSIPWWSQEKYCDQTMRTSVTWAHLGSNFPVWVSHSLLLRITFVITSSWQMTLPKTSGQAESGLCLLGVKAGARYTTRVLEMNDLAQHVTPMLEAWRAYPSLGSRHPIPAQPSPFLSHSIHHLSFLFPSVLVSCLSL
jgi:hypothetical protein